MKKVLLYVSFVTALVSCNNDKTAPRWEEKHNTREFGAVISMETYPVVVDEFMNIKDLSAKGSACLPEKYRSAVIQLYSYCTYEKKR